VGLVSVSQLVTLHSHDARTFFELHAMSCSKGKGVVGRVGWALMM
jgi:hypothetical protein